MKINSLYASILSLSLPFSAFSLGLGEVSVHSFLNQPFSADIPLTDSHNVSLESIKVSLASPENYERAGLEQREIVSFLTFAIKKNSQGRPVISITSTERISEPYLQIVVDLVWPKGQIYRAYMILLDPPNYQFEKPKSITVSNVVKINKIDLGEPGVIHKPIYHHIQGDLKQINVKPTYGPTVANDTIWQIAQRYTTPEINLQQVILAIVGTNLAAFTQGNLNALKAGEQLIIPTSEEMAKVPAQLAKDEVLAHDIAWKNKEEIKHIILPPYVNVSAKTSSFHKMETIYYPSKIAAIPKLSLEPTVSSTPSSLPAPEVFFTPSQTLTSYASNQSINPVVQKKDASINAEIGMALAAINAVRTDNSLMKEQMNKLKATNTQLQQQLNQQQKELIFLHQQLNLITQERQGLHAQTLTLPKQSSSHSWLYWLIIGALGIIIVYGVVYWLWLKNRENQNDQVDEDKIEPLILTTQPIIPPKPTVDNPLENKGEFEQDLLPYQQNRDVIEPLTNDNKERANDELDLEPTHELDFEPGLDKLIKPEPTPFASNETPLDVIDRADKQTLSDNNTDYLDVEHSNKTILPTSDPNQEQVIDAPGLELNELNFTTTSPHQDTPLEASVNDFNQGPSTTIPSQESTNQSETKLVKSSAALDTLLSLSKTYIEMEDFESAQQSLQEVLEFGNENQKEEAQKLLNKITK